MWETPRSKKMIKPIKSKAVTVKEKNTHVVVSSLLLWWCRGFESGSWPRPPGALCHHFHVTGCFPPAGSPGDNRLICGFMCGSRTNKRPHCSGGRGCWLSFLWGAALSPVDRDRARCRLKACSTQPHFSAHTVERTHKQILKRFKNVKLNVTRAQVNALRGFFTLHQDQRTCCYGQQSVWIFSGVPWLEKKKKKFGKQLVGA